MKQRLVALDYLRVFATILVIAVHADHITISPSNYLGGISWWLATSLNTLGRVAVPLFVMISGALIYKSSKANSFSSALTRSWTRIIVPGIFWVTFYFLWQNRWHGDGLQLNYIFSQLYHSSFGYLHYLFIILGLYLATPLLQVIPATRRSAIAWSSMDFMIIFEYIRYTGAGWAWTGDTPLLWISYIPYYLLGAVLLDLKLHKNIEYFLLLITTVSLGVAISSTYFANLDTISGHPAWWMGQGVSYFWGHFSITDSVIAIGIYYFVFRFLSKGIKPWLDQKIASLGTATYGIYLSHVMVMEAIEHYGNLGVQYVTHDLWFYYLSLIFLIFLFSYLLVRLIRFLRLGGLLLGEKQ